MLLIFKQKYIIEYKINMNQLSMYTIYFPGHSENEERQSHQTVVGNVGPRLKRIRPPDGI